MRIQGYLGKEPPYDLYEMELIGDPIFTVAVPVDASEDLKRKVVGALKTHCMGTQSVDYVIKSYGSEWVFSPPEEDRLFLLKTLRAAENIIDTIREDLSGRTGRPGAVGLLAAKAALIRLSATFRSAMLLVMQGYPFEAAAMCRIILEQYGFAYAVFKIDDPEEISRIKSSKTISNLKRLLPYAGKTYSYLSSHTHLAPKGTRHYVDRENGNVVVRYVLPESTRIVVCHFLRLVVDFSKVVKEVFGDSLELRNSLASNDLKEDYVFIGGAAKKFISELREGFS